MQHSEKCENLFDKIEYRGDFIDFCDENNIKNFFISDDDYGRLDDVNDILISFYSDFIKKINKRKGIIYFYFNDKIIYINETEEKVIKLMNDFLLKKG